MALQLDELATRFNLELRGQAEAEIHAVASLQMATAGDISFCIGRRHLAELEKTRASAVIIHPKLSGSYHGNALLSENPHAAFAKIADFLHPQGRKPAGIHPSAEVDAKATIHESSSVAEYVTIEKSANIAAGCQIGAGCYIGEKVEIGENTILKNNVTLHHEVTVGCNCILQTGCVVGSDG